MIRQATRYLLKQCIDCGCSLTKEYNRGDVCKKCFAECCGMTIEELISVNKSLNQIRKL